MEILREVEVLFEDYSDKFPKAFKGVQVLPDSVKLHISTSCIYQFLELKLYDKGNNMILQFFDVADGSAGSKTLSDQSVLDIEKLKEAIDTFLNEFKSKNSWFDLTPRHVVLVYDAIKDHGPKFLPNTLGFDVRRCDNNETYDIELYQVPDVNIWHIEFQIDIIDSDPDIKRMRASFLGYDVESLILEFPEIEKITKKEAEDFVEEVLKRFFADYFSINYSGYDTHDFIKGEMKKES